MFYCLHVQLYHLCGKSRFVCAHIGQNRHIYPPSIFRLHFDSYPPSPFSAGWRWGLLSRKIFYFFSDFHSYLSEVWIEIIFFEFYTRYSYLEIFFIFSKHCFNSSSFHSVFLISFYLFSFYTRLITIWSLLHIVENNGFDMILDYDSDFASDLRLVFTRIKLCRFYALFLQLFISLTILLVINKHLCLYEFVLCLFWLF